MQKVKKISILTACLLICLTTCLIFVGCGNSDPNKITLNQVTHSIFYAPLYVAQNMGFFKDEGLDVTIETATGSDASMTALLSGSADMILAGPETVVYTSTTKDHPIVFGQLTQKDGSFIVSRDEIDGEFTLDMLKGKTIIGGRAGGLPAMTLEYIIKQAGLTIGENTSAGEVNLRTDVAFNNIASEFQTSGNEFCTLFEPNATTLENQGKGHVVSAVGNVSGEIPYTCFATKSSYLENNSEQVEKFLKAVKRGYQYIANNDSSIVAEALAPSFVGMTKEELQIAVEQYLAIDAWSDDMIMSETSFNKLVEIINSTQGTSYNPEFSELIDNLFAEKIA